MSSFEKSIWNSLTTPEQEQEPYRDGVPMLGQQIEQRFFSELQEHFNCGIWRTARKVSKSSSFGTRTKCSSRTAILAASWCIV